MIAKLHLEESICVIVTHLYSVFLRHPYLKSKSFLPFLYELYLESVVAVGACIIIERCLCCAIRWCRVLLYT